MKTFESLNPDEIPNELQDLYGFAVAIKNQAMNELRGDQPDLGQIHMLEFTAVERELRAQLSLGKTGIEQSIIVQPIAEKFHIAA